MLVTDKKGFLWSFWVISFYYRRKGQNRHIHYQNNDHQNAVKQWVTTYRIAK